MGYWNWINEIYNFEDACFQYFREKDKSYQLQKIIINNLGEDYLYDKNGDYKIKLKDEYDGFKLGNYKNEKLSPKEKLGQQLKETQEKLNIAVEALEFYDDVLSHHDKCNYPFHECRCMDRTIYNEENSIENARQALTKIKGE